MSDMMFREPNQVKWQGSRPGHNGTQVLENTESNVLNWVVLYTVPAGQTLFLTMVSFSWDQSVNNVWKIAIYDDVPALWKTLAIGRAILAAGNPFWMSTFWPPIEVPAGYHIQRYQDVAIAPCFTIHGWTE